MRTADFTQINPDFVDRIGRCASPMPVDGIAYSPSIGDQRDKWEIDYVVKVVPGQNAFGNAGGVSVLAVGESEPCPCAGAVADNRGGFSRQSF